MIIYFSPQVNDTIIDYQFQGETVTATIDGITDTFNFSVLANDNEVAKNDETGLLDIETTLPILPILDARRDGEVLKVTVLSWITEDANESERFLEPMEVV